MKKSILLLLLVLTVLAASVFSVQFDNTKAQTSSISEDAALVLAISYSADDGLVGGAVAPPEKIYGQIMTYNEAVLFVLNKPIGQNTTKNEMRNNIVWLIVLDGEFVEHVPPSPDGSIPAIDIAHNQMAIILDGKTGDILRRILPPSHIKLSVANLPLLETTDNIAPDLPTQIPISTEIPFPTLTPSP